MSTQRFLLLSPEEIEGIGPTRSASLQTGGITTIAELFAAGAPRVHALCPGAGAREVGEWFCKAMLLRVAGVTSDLADALVRMGIRTAKKLANMDLDNLEKAVNEVRASGRLRSAPTLYDLSKIQKAAWKLEGFGMLAGRLRHENGHPIRDAAIDIGSQTTRTNDDGWYAFEKVQAGTIRARIQIEGRPLPLELRPITLREGKLTGPLLQRLSTPAGATFKLPVLRELDGTLIVHTRGTRIELVWRSLEDFQDGSFLEVRNLGQDGYSRLLSHFKERVAHVIHIVRARVKIDQLPAGAKEGDILRYSNGHLEPTPLTRRDLVTMKREAGQTADRRTTRRVLRLPR